jgi:hypothetical protein
VDEGNAAAKKFTLKAALAKYTKLANPFVS